MESRTPSGTCLDGWSKDNELRLSERSIAGRWGLAEWRSRVGRAVQ